MSRIAIEPIETKGIITGKGKADPWFHGEYGCNLYQGCEHDCLYCDGKSDWYRMHKEFGTLIKYKANAVKLIRAFFQKKGLVSSKTPKITDFFERVLPKSPKKTPKFLLGIGGGVCDVYQPTEKKVKLTRRVLELCLEYEVPIFLLTKNAEVIRRDIPLLCELNERAFVRIGFSVTLADPDVKKIFEPYSSSTEARFQTMKELNSLGIEAGGLFLPIIPLIGDTNENIEAIVRRAKWAGAKFLLHGGMTLKPGHKENFLKTIAEQFPEFLTAYDLMYEKSFSPDPKIYKSSGWRVHELCKKYNVPEWMPRYVPPGQIAENLLGAAHLWALSFLYYWKKEQKNGERFSKAGYIINELKRPWSSLDKKPLDKDVMETLSKFKETGSSPLYETLY
ncbi:MAG: radical SAM protein [Candidatus Hodarchaeota archaeon]